MSISKIFEISKRSLLSQQYAIDVTARNIANVNTEGYKRRAVDLTKLGFGFSALNGSLNSRGITRIRQQFAETQLWYENQNLGKHQTNEMMLTRVEDIFGEPNDSGLANILSEFWNAWNDLANDPESQAIRGIVRDKGSLLANTFNRLHTDFRNFQNQIGKDIQEKIVLINQQIRQIGVINEQMGVNGSDDLQDRRDLLITELSSLINIDIREDENGIVTISSGGLILVSGESSNELTAKVTMENRLLKVDVRLSGIGRSVTVTSGKLGGLLEVHNEHIPEQVEKINTLAAAIVKQVNTVHASGYNLDGITGINFFKDGINSADEFQLSGDILNDASLIASSSTINEHGEGSIAQAISDIQFDQIIESNTISDYYNTMISHIGSQVREASFMRETQESIIQSLQNQRDSVSGVSIDEEMTKLIEYQYAYQAAARMISTADEMIQTVLNLI